MKRKIVFMGTPFFAKEILEHLLTFKEIDVIAVIAQPDKKLGRKKKIVYSEVKEFCLQKDLLLFQPENIKTWVITLRDLNPDKIITCAYGQFLPQAILDFGVINIHASLLPKYRGGAPMQHAIKNNEKITGISLMKSVLKMDAGPVYAQESVAIDVLDTLSSLELKLIDASKKLLDKTLLDILEDTIEPQAQDESQVSFSLTIKREDELIDFNRDNLIVYNHLRSLIENPAGYAFINGKRLKFLKVRLGASNTHFPPSTIDFSNPEVLEISTINGTIQVLECQLEGKNRLTVSEMFNGYYHSFHLRRLNHEN